MKTVLRAHGLLLYLVAALVAAVAVPVRGQNPQAPRPTPTGTAFLAGEVIDVSNGRPVPDAVVSLTVASQSLSGNLMFNQVPNAPSVATDSQGRYFFASLPAGAYSPRASKIGYTPASTVANRAITLTDGERIADLNIRLARFGTVSGTLRDDAGDPVVGTDVIALRRSLVNGRPSLRPSGQARSDDHGRYRVTSLPAGDYIVCACTRDSIPFDPVLLTTLAADPIHLLGVASRALSAGADVAQLDTTLRTFAPTFYPSSATISGATRVAVGPGDDKSSVDFELTPTVSTRVSGMITGGISPILAPQVKLVPAGESDEAVGITELTPMVVQADGRFDFAGVPPGQYVLRVTHGVTSARGGTPSGDALAFLGARAAGPLPSPGTPDDSVTWASAPVTVGPEGARDLAVALRPAIRMNGRVQFAGAAAQPSAQDLSRLVVLLQPVAGQPLPPQTVIGRVNADGAFQFPSVLPGKYFVNTTLVPNWTSLKSITLRGTDLTDLPVEVGESDPGELVFTFSDAATATLAGQSGASAPGGSKTADDVTALIFPSDTRFWTDPAAALRRFRAVPVTHEGSFPPIPLAAGEYFVAIVPDAKSAEWQERSQFDALARTAQRVRIGDGEHKVLEIRR